ncbi:MAG TPA: cytochrome P450, partial [Micromonospora sp.]
MATMPRDSGPDNTLAFLRDGYRYISDRCDRLHTDVFATRLMLRPTICLRGREAAELFYDETRFQRAGAAPSRLQRTLVGVGGVQGMDDEAHRHRKAMLMSVVTPQRVRDLAETVRWVWLDRIDAWERAGRVVLYDEVGRILTRAVCDWAGV